MEFTGFCPQGLDLLIENRMMDSPDFYEAHKADIKRLAIEPFYALCERMREDMLLIDPLFVTTPSLVWFPVYVEIRDTPKIKHSIVLICGCFSAVRAHSLRKFLSIIWNLGLISGAMAVGVASDEAKWQERAI